MAKQRPVEGNRDSCSKSLRLKLALESQSESNSAVANQRGYGSIATRNVMCARSRVWLDDVSMVAQLVRLIGSLPRCELQYSANLK